MNNDYIIKTLILSISFMGIAIFMSGIIFLLFSETVSRYPHYILPIPPLGVAAYVFVFNFYIKYNGQPPEDLRLVFTEILLATLIAAMVFLFFSMFIIVFTNLVKNLV